MPLSSITIQSSTSCFIFGRRSRAASYRARYSEPSLFDRGGQQFAALPIHVFSDTRKCSTSTAAAPHAVQPQLQSRRCNHDVLLDVLDLELQDRHPDADTSGGLPSSSTTLSGQRVRNHPHVKHLDGHGLSPDLVHVSSSHGQHNQRISNGSNISMRGTTRSSTWIPAVSSRSRYAMKKQIQGSGVTEVEMGAAAIEAAAEVLGFTGLRDLNGWDNGIADSSLERSSSAMINGLASTVSATVLDSVDYVSNAERKIKTCKSPPKAAMQSRSQHQSKTTTLPGSALLAAYDSERRDTLRRQRFLTSEISCVLTWTELAGLFSEQRSALNHIHICAMLVKLVQLEGLAQSTDSQKKLPRRGWRFMPLRWNRRLMLRLRKRLKDREKHHRRLVTSGTRHHDIPGGNQASSRDFYGGGSLPTRKYPTAQYLARALCREAESHVGSMGLREIAGSLSAVLKLRCPLEKPSVLRFMTRAFHVLGRDNKRLINKSHQRPEQQSHPEHMCSFGEGTRNQRVHEQTKEIAAEDGHDVNAQGLSSLIWAVSGFGMRGLRQDWANRFLTSVSLRIPEFSSQGIAVLLHSLAALGHMPPPDLRQRLMERLVDLAERDMQQRQKPHSGRFINGSRLQNKDRISDRIEGERRRLKTGRGFVKPMRLSPADVSMTMRALALLRTHPPGDLGDRLLLSTCWMLPSFSAQELANTIWGLAKLRKPPPSDAWSADFLAATAKTILGQPSNHQQLQPHRRRQGALTESSKGGNFAHLSASPSASGAQALSMTLYSAAILKLRPDEAWVAACLRYTTEHFSSFTIQGLASVVYALALLGYHPGKRWMVDFHRGIESSLKDIPPESMAMLHKAYGILKFSAGRGSSMGASSPTSLLMGDTTIESDQEAPASVSAWTSSRRGGQSMPSERPSRFAAR